MTMIERVAKAIAAAHGNDFDRLPNFVGGLRKVYLNSAMAAIEAMREPTPEMIASAESQFPLFADEYRRAIDAALKETS